MTDNMELLTHNGKEILLDADDYELLRGHKWYESRRGYAVCYIRVNSHFKSSRMINLIIGKVTCDFVPIRKIIEMGFLGQTLAANTREFRGARKGKYGSLILDMAGRRLIWVYTTAKKRRLKPTIKRLPSTLVSSHR